MDKENKSNESLASIRLTQGKQAIIESKYLDIVNICKWHFNKGYAYNSQKGYMHRFLWESVNGKIPKGLQIDHKNRDKLDNRLSNLRVVTNQQNHMNLQSYKNSSSIYKGVSWKKDKNKWRAQITINGKQKHLGYYNSEVEAARAYDATAKNFEHAFLNFPNPQDQETSTSVFPTKI